jgi:hypothetical protein
LLTVEESIHAIIDIVVYVTLPLVILLGILLPLSYFFKKRKIMRLDIPSNEKNLFIHKAIKRRVVIFSIFFLIFALPYTVTRIWDGILRHDAEIQTTFYVQDGKLMRGKQGAIIKNSFRVTAQKGDWQTPEEVTIDVSSFENLPCKYSKDKHYVYVEKWTFSTCGSQFMYLRVVDDVSPGDFVVPENSC